MKTLELIIDNKPVFANLYPRAYARIIDQLALGLFSWVCYFAGKGSVALFIVALAGNLFVSTTYLVYANYKYGATLGKFVAGIRVTNLDGGTISLKQAFLRAGIDLALQFLRWSSFAVLLSNVGLSQFQSAGIFERHFLISESAPIWDYLVSDALPVIWLISGLIVFICNKRRRAIHDFIAGTAVIYEQFSEIGKTQHPIVTFGKSGFTLNIKTLITQIILLSTIAALLGVILLQPW